MSNCKNPIFDDTVPVNINIPVFTYGFLNICSLETCISIEIKEDNLPFDKHITAKMSILNGTLKLYNEEKLIGFFEKDHILAY